MEASFLIRQVVVGVVALVSTLVLMSVLRLPSDLAPVVQGMAIFMASFSVWRTLEAREREAMKLRQENLDNWVTWQERNRVLEQDNQLLTHQASALDSRLEESSKAAEAVPDLEAKLARIDCRLREVQGERDEFRWEARTLRDSLQISQHYLKNLEGMNKILKTSNEALKRTVDVFKPTVLEGIPAC